MVGGGRKRAIDLSLIFPVRLGGEWISLGWGLVVDLVSCEVLVRSHNTNLTS